MNLIISHINKKRKKFWTNQKWLYLWELIIVWKLVKQILWIHLVRVNNFVKTQFVWKSSEKISQLGSSLLFLINYYKSYEIFAFLLFEEEKKLILWVNAVNSESGGNPVFWW